MTPAFQKGGAAILRDRIEAAKAEGKSELTVSGRYEIEETVLLPSDFTLILSDCHLRLADGTYCQMFRNESAFPGCLLDAKMPDRNIRLLGHGKAILDGGIYNGLSEQNYGRDGLPHISQNNMILFCNVEDFCIEGIEIRRQRWWGINLLSCRHGQLRGIRFEADDTRTDESGRTVHGLDRAKYMQTNIKNADGIDLRRGCHDILIENITGFTEDDSIALTGLYGTTEEMYATTAKDDAIYNITIRNICTSAFCTQVRLLNQSGAKLYNILVDGVFDGSADGRYYTGRGVASVRVGDARLYGTRHSTAEETKNIVIRNVFSRAEFALRLAGAVSDLHYENIFGFDGCPALLEDLREA